MTPKLIPLIFCLHLAATLYMTGLIWFVQVVHYPLMAKVGPDHFPAYEQAHTRLTGRIVAPVMLLELATALALLRFRPTSLSLAMPIAGLALLAIIWLSTWALQIPCHNALSAAFDPATHHRLVTSNWLRTTCWTLRSALALLVTARLLRP